MFFFFQEIEDFLDITLLVFPFNRTGSVHLPLESVIFTDYSQYYSQEDDFSLVIYFVQEFTLIYS